VRGQGAVLEVRAPGRELWGEIEAARRVAEDPASEDDPALVRGEQAGHGRQDRRLAGARRPDQGERLPLDARLEVEGQARQAMPDLELENAVHPARALSARPALRISF